MSNEIVKFSNQFNNVALKKFDAVHLDVLMAIASRVREKGTATVEFSFEELRGLMRLRKSLTNKQLADKIVQTNARLLALNYMFEYFTISSDMTAFYHKNEIFIFSTLYSPKTSFLFLKSVLYSPKTSPK